MDAFLCALPLSPTSYPSRSCNADLSPIAFQPPDDLFPLTPPPLTNVSPVVRAESMLYQWALSPLTPLTDLGSPQRLKRKWVDDSPCPAKNKSRRTLRSTRLYLPPPHPSPSPSPSPSRSPSPSPSPDLVPIYTTRSFEGHSIPPSPYFSLLYRRFPVSSYYAPSETVSPLTLFNPTHPGGIYNPPRSPLDLYTPRFVRGKGVTKHGLCPICVEPRARGGASRRVWLAMKFSAFKCYHMQYYHGISASTGSPYSPPLAFRVTPRPQASKNERSAIREAKCHKCNRWVPVEGIKAIEAKVKELFWWKHAAICHGSSTLDAPHDVYENDSVYAVVSKL